MAAIYPSTTVTGGQDTYRQGYSYVTTITYGNYPFSNATSTNLIGMEYIPEPKPKKKAKDRSRSIPAHYELRGEQVQVSLPAVQRPPPKLMERAWCSALKSFKRI